MNKGETLLKKYKGYAIVVTESGKFRAYQMDEEGRSTGDIVLEKGTLGTLQSLLKEKAKLVVQNKVVLYREEPSSWRYSGSHPEDSKLQYIEGKVTQVVVKSGRNYYTVRTGETDGSGYRDSELQVEGLVKPTPENRKRIERIIQLWKEEQSRENEREKLEEELEHWTDTELLH